jgi:hypothetical protein
LGIVGLEIVGLLTIADPGIADWLVAHLRDPPNP